MRLIALDMGALIAGAKYWVGFKLKVVLKEVEEKGKVILFIDEIHLVLGAGCSEGSMDAANFLSLCLQEVYVAEPSVADTINILRGLKEKYEGHHGVKIQDRALVVVAQLSARYITEWAIALGVTEAATYVILAKSCDPVYGARPIRRWLEKRVVTELSKMLIKEEIDEKPTVYMDAAFHGKELTYRVEKKGGLVNAATGEKSDILIQIPNGSRSDAFQAGEVEDRRNS
ncbi:chaperone 1 [Olea europaea subsp. europaea]|uniref:Chaperone 1 n=1 Tax=Olea europaea subsp. europaea TaxID=158383 RepID=A0A8S0V0N1_OLEEU|nr:chaperone 1 [Olea europaea subsp. europaea]